MNKEDASIFPLTKSEKEILQHQDLTAFILRIRNEQVILDRDLARLYGVETRVLNQAVKRNIARFPNNLFKTVKEIFKNRIIESRSFLLLSFFLQFVFILYSFTGNTIVNNSNFVFYFMGVGLFAYSLRYR